MGDYAWFLDNFTKRVFGVTDFTRRANKELISSMLSVTDEAYAMLLYANSHQRWTDMVNNGTGKSKMKGRWTDGGFSNKESGRSRRGMGWDPQAYVVFNSILNPA